MPLQDIDNKKIRPIEHENVMFNDKFWSPRIEINRSKTIPFQYEQCKLTGRFEALKLKWKPGDKDEPHPFWDSDVAKWIESASYSLSTQYDPELDDLIDSVIGLIASAQHSDGYLNTYFTVVKPGERWTDLRDAHELYCAGHLIEAGVAHYESTKKHSLINIVCKYADYIDQVFGKEPDKLRGYPGHEEIELALVKLYRVTGNERYLKLSAFFVEERGQEPHYFDLEEQKRGNAGYFGDIAHYFRDRKEYNQSHLPVKKQTEAKGHSVRAMYLYSAMADLAYERGDTELQKACERLWDNVTTKKMYITGGIGSKGGNEGFSDDYHLPNQSYAETCAAVGMVFWNHRMLQLDCDRKYADLLEQTLYNGVLGGVSLDGKRFFYANPLASNGDNHRKKWYGIACCPPNVARLLASLGQYFYSYDDEHIIVHLYAESRSNLEIKNQSVQVEQKTHYPWDGNISLTLHLDQPLEFGLKLRIPGWCEEAIVKVNGKPVENGDLDKGYLTINRRWENGDKVEMVLKMSVQKRFPHPNIAENAGCVALQRGPILYCMEGTDHHTALHKIFLPKEGELVSKYDDALLNGVTFIEGEGFCLDNSSWQNSLYSHERPTFKPVKIRLVPYYSWDNREPGDMQVWIKELNDI